MHLTWQAYAAPEMSDPHAGGYDCRFDTWGYGVILFVVLCGYHPYVIVIHALVQPCARVCVCVCVCVCMCTYDASPFFFFSPVLRCGALRCPQI